MDSVQQEGGLINMNIRKNSVERQEFYCDGEDN